MRLLHALLLLPLFSVPVFAETAAPTATEHHGRRSAAEHFADANTTHDGKLTLDQATSGYKSIAKAFSQIDTNHRGYVTVDDIKAWKAAKKAARQAAKHAADDTASDIISPKQAMHHGATPGPIDASTDRIVPGSTQSPRQGTDLPTAPLDRASSS
jgi:hypothetical protein